MAFEGKDSIIDRSERASEGRSLMRYANSEVVGSELDPFADVLEWLGGLRSEDLVRELLREQHGMPPKITPEAAKAIAAHARTAIDLVEQAYAGRSQVSFLPLYYAMLDFAKIAAICSGRLADVRKQKTHGASWIGATQNSKQLLTDRIAVFRRGAIPLFYETLTGVPWPVQGTKSTAFRSLKMSQVYTNIPAISIETFRAFELKSEFVVAHEIIDEPKPGFWRTVLDFGSTVPSARQRSVIPKLKPAGGNRMVSRLVEASTWPEAHALLRRDVRWCFLYSHMYTVDGRVTFQLSRSQARLHMPEEFPILLAFFHLGNVVRYDPERLQKLFDSKASAVLETLRRHGMFHYMRAIWCYVTQTQTLIRRS